MNETLIKAKQAFKDKYNIELDLDSIVSKTRVSDIIYQRAILCVYLKKNGLSLSKIGRIMGGRTHATVINLLKYDTKRQSRCSSFLDLKNAINGTSKYLMISELKDRLNFHKARVIQIKKELKELTKGY